MSKKITLIISLFFFATVFSAFQIGTLVYTPYGKKAIEQLQVGGELVSYQDGLLVFKKVIHKCVREEKESVSFVVGGETFVTSHDQKWYLSYKKVWKKACELNVGDVLCTQANNACTIDSLEFIDHRIEMVEITVQDTHTFFVGKQGILAHNFTIPILAPIVTWFCANFQLELGLAIGGLILKKSLSNREARKKAQEWGYRETNEGKINTHGKPKFIKGDRIITPDADGHNGGAWKEFDRRGRRIGTLDEDGNKIKG